MVLEKLSQSFKDTISKIKNSLKVDKNLIDEIIKDIQKILISSDVNVRLVLDLTKIIRKRAIEEDISTLKKNEHLITIIYEEITKFLGKGEVFELKKGGQNRILLIGLYGQGKTTTCSKLGNYFKVRGKKIALISTDTYRPAALEQLKQLGEKIKVDVFGNEKEKDATKIYLQFEKKLKEYDIVLIDSCGRDNLNDELIKEINSLNKIIKPTDTFLVLGADVGQTAQKQAETFKENLNITGVIITKMDGTGKGGGAISSCNVVNAPVRFIGTGEKVDDFEKFDSEKFVSELLGFGNLEGLLEKVQLVVDEKKAHKIQEKIMSGNFDLEDVYIQLKSMKKMGSMSKIMSMIPGLGSLKVDKKDLEKQESKMKKWGYAINSMTKFEKKNPQELNISRLERISKGSGVKIELIRELLKQHKQMKKMSGLLKDPQKLQDMQNKSPEEMMEMMKKSGFKNMKQMKKFMK